MKPWIFPTGLQDKNGNQIVCVRGESTQIGAVGKDPDGWRAFPFEGVNYTTYLTRGEAAQVLYDLHQGQKAADWIRGAEPPVNPRHQVVPRSQMARYGYSLPQGTGLSTKPKTDREAWVTEQVSLWIQSDGDYIQQARNLVKNTGVLSMSQYLTSVVKQARPHSAPWHVAQELAPNDFDRIDWNQVADDIKEEG